MRSLLAFLIAGAFAVPASAYEQVQIADGEFTLTGVLFKPAGEGPFPAVVALHGCAGLGGRNDPVGLHYRDWGERLTAAGYAVVFPDSFGSRGAGPQCTERDRRITPRVERVRDANASRRWLQTQGWVKKERVFLLGWSHGGSTTLWTVRPQVVRRPIANDFRSAIAFYPGCARPSVTAWSSRLPTLVLIGDADDWTPAKPCEAMVEGARGRSAQVEIVTYPGAHHGFDHPNLPLRQRTGLAFTPDGSGRAHVGSNPSARADAIRRVAEWLAR